MRNKTFSCAMHNLRRLASSPRNWAILLLTVLCLDRYIAPIRGLMVDEGLTIGIMPLLVFFMNDSWLTALAGVGFLVLLFDLPMADEAQKYLLIRSGRRAWAKGQVVYIMIAAAIYMIFLAAVILIWVSPWLEWNLGWSQTITRFVNGAYEKYDSMINYDHWLLECYSPIAAFAIQAILHYICFATLAVAMGLFNSLIGSRAGFLIAMIPLMIDTVLTEITDVFAWYFSPVTITRLSCLDYGDGMMRPPVWYAFIFLGALWAVFAFIFVAVHRKKEVRL